VWLRRLRPGNVHRAEDWEELPVPEVNRQLLLGKEVVFRADAAFPKPEIYEALEERGVKYAIRMPANDSLERDIAELLTRPVGKTEPQTRGLAQGLSLSGDQLEDGAAPEQVHAVEPLTGEKNYVAIRGGRGTYSPKSGTKRTFRLMILGS